MDVVGVGPHPDPWPDDPRLDPELLAGGDRRNVVDRYRYWRRDAIVADLDDLPTPVPRGHRELGARLQHRQCRSDRQCLPRGGGAHRRKAALEQTRARWSPIGTSTSAITPMSTSWCGGREEAGVPLVGIDNLPGAVPLETYQLPERCVLVFGQEGPGLSDAVRAASVATVSIAQFGSTRSINAGAAAAIAMHTWMPQHALSETRSGAVIGGPVERSREPQSAGRAASHLVARERCRPSHGGRRIAPA